MIILTRDDKSKSGTHGVLEIEDHIYHTLEQPDRGNKPYESCVPQGIYELAPHKSKKYGDCFIMVNEDLNVYKYENSPGRPDDGRFLCLFVHRGSYVHNFQGCIGAGRRFLEDQDMIVHTRATCEIVNKLVIQEASYKLEIKYNWE